METVKDDLILHSEFHNISTFSFRYQKCLIKIKKYVFFPIGGLQLGFVAGVILRERLPAFERMLWRACRGNVFLRQAEIEDPLEDPQLGNEGDEVYKSVFIIFFQGKVFKREWETLKMLPCL